MELWTGGNLVHVDHASAVKKGDHQKFVCGFALSGLLGSERTSMLPLGTLSLGHSSRSSFHRRSPEHQELRDLNWSARPSRCCHDNVFLSDLLWAPLGQTSRKSSTSSVPCEYLCVQFPHCLSMKFFIWPINSGVLTYLLLPHLSSSLTDSLPSLNLLCHSKTDAQFMQDGPKAVWNIPNVVSVTFFPGLKQNFIAYQSVLMSRLHFWNSPAVTIRL